MIKCFTVLDLDPVGYVINWPSGSGSFLFYQVLKEILGIKLNFVRFLLKNFIILYSISNMYH
jgi:hypothetical protein